MPKVPGTTIFSLLGPIERHPAVSGMVKMMVQFKIVCRLETRVGENELLDSYCSLKSFVTAHLTHIDRGTIGVKNGD